MSTGRRSGRASSKVVKTQADVSLELAYEQCGRLVGTADARLLTPDTTTDRYYLPVTGWIPTLLADKVKMALVVRNRVGNFTCRLAAQFATTTRENPGAWGNIGTDTFSTNDEFNTGEEVVGGSSDMFVRFGLHHYLTTSGTNGGADVSVAIGIRKT